MTPSPGWCGAWFATNGSATDQAIEAAVTELLSDPAQAALAVQQLDSRRHT